jgi:hypothetical protein
MLRLDRSRIEKVFCDQKAAAEDRQFKAKAAICSAIKNGTRSGGHYFAHWDDCDQALQDEYLARGELLPARRANGGMPVEKLHPVTSATTQTFSSVAEVVRVERLARASLLAAISSGCVAKGYRWRFAKGEDVDP